MQIYSKVMKGIERVNFPVRCQGNVSDLIKALLKRVPNERLPMKAGGVNNLKDHKWYSENKLDWEKALNQDYPCPYKPVVKSKIDIANFTARKEDRPKYVEYKDDGSGWDRNFKTSD